MTCHNPLYSFVVRYPDSKIRIRTSIHFGATRNSAHQLMLPPCLQAWLCVSIVCDVIINLTESRSTTVLEHLVNLKESWFISTAGVSGNVTFDLPLFFLFLGLRSYHRLQSRLAGLLIYHIVILSPELWAPSAQSAPYVWRTTNIDRKSSYQFKLVKSTLLIETGPRLEQRFGILIRKPSVIHHHAARFPQSRLRGGGLWSGLRNAPSIVSVRPSIHPSIMLWLANLICVRGHD